MATENQSWIDLINQKGKDLFSNFDLGAVANTYAVKNGLIQVGTPPTGNLTAEQIAAGQRGNITGLSLPETVKNWMMPAIILVVGIVAYFLIKRK